MSRLIDADALMKVLESYKFGAISNEVERAYIKETVMSFVTDLPTAYDVEKVVAAEENFLVNFGVPKDTKVHKKIIGIIRKGGAE